MNLFGASKTLAKNMMSQLKDCKFEGMRVLKITGFAISNKGGNIVAGQPKNLAFELC
ncbi:MAG: hypothetical protein CM15mP109_13520 [Candidatus Dadabacteria bacterium]|nr:MAG: hypothetical protein CM15mP109_13520 [Candidatus Dadabacteria bacterium]